MEHYFSRIFSNSDKVDKYSRRLKENNLGKIISIKFLKQRSVAKTLRKRC